MFTGIVEEVGTVKAASSEFLLISARKVLEELKPGDSISVSGACLTVTYLEGEAFQVELMPETLRRTNLGELRPGDQVNLERALRFGARIGGHFVQGHVDGVGRILSRAAERGAELLKISAPRELLRYLVEKGFVAVEGVSLTIVQKGGSYFVVSLVRYTLENTNLGSKRPGDRVNLEVDILAKYLEQLQQEGAGSQSSGLSPEFLAEHGFLQ